MSWQTEQVTHMTREGKDQVAVICPFPKCRQVHTHPLASAGGEVVAGCHAGYTRCRSYRLPNLRKKGKNR